VFVGRGPSLTLAFRGLQVLHLVEQLSRALNDEFRAHLPEILPRCVQVLTLAEQTGDYSSVPPVLHAFEVFGSERATLPTPLSY
jgi:FKBP12-rapamycin complex-associated protein